MTVMVMEPSVVVGVLGSLPTEETAVKLGAGSTSVWLSGVSV